MSYRERDGRVPALSHYRPVLRAALFRTRSTISAVGVNRTRFVCGNVPSLDSSHTSAHPSWVSRSATSCALLFEFAKTVEVTVVFPERSGVPLQRLDHVSRYPFDGFRIGRPPVIVIGALRRTTPRFNANRASPGMFVFDAWRLPVRITSPRSHEKP